MANNDIARKTLPTGRQKRKRATAAQVDAHRPETLITYRVSVLAQVLSRLVDASVRANLDLTSRQWRVLVVLSRLGGTSSSGAIARTASFDHSQVSRVTMELSDKGLLKMSSDPEDRRKQILTLTPEGTELLRQGLPHSMEREERLRGRLTESEYASFIKVIGLLEDEADKLLEDVRKGE
ncbi:MarR family winged helix-turn-helix transcriptional regulator [Bordetella genomosp. 5]|uniref:HTH marR-type domain-containing protein n=1 Tax=Bordetella genomosp. 5 TaxID=1395608 RepID=A0A261TY50_9BORD|nr:MarR family transcriptional regulator [Bordetella genomosp. 5]OZI54187.1 hypothetical protein CAL25_05250 [Bordetella genomosp. 5]